MAAGKGRLERPVVGRNELSPEARPQRPVWPRSSPRPCGSATGGTGPTEKHRQREASNAGAMLGGSSLAPDVLACQVAGSSRAPACESLHAGCVATPHRAPLGRVEQCPMSAVASNGTSGAVSGWRLNGAKHLDESREPAVDGRRVATRRTRPSRRWRPPKLDVGTPRLNAGRHDRLLPRASRGGASRRLPGTL